MSVFFNRAAHGLEIHLKQVAVLAEPRLRLFTLGRLNGHDVSVTQRVVCLNKRINSWTIRQSITKSWAFMMRQAL